MTGVFIVARNTTVGFLTIDAIGVGGRFVTTRSLPGSLVPGAKVDTPNDATNRHVLERKAARLIASGKDTVHRQKWLPRVDHPDGISVYGRALRPHRSTTCLVAKGGSTGLITRSPRLIPVIATGPRQE